MATTYVDETLKRIQGYPGVVGTIAMTFDGAVIKTTLDQKTATEYSYKVADICEKTKAMIRNIDNENDLNLLRMRTRKHEMIIVPDKDYILVTIKAPAAPAE